MTSKESHLSKTIKDSKIKDEKDNNISLNQFKNSFNQNHNVDYITKKKSIRFKQPSAIERSLLSRKSNLNSKLINKQESWRKPTSLTQNTIDHNNVDVFSSDTEYNTKLDYTKPLLTQRFEVKRHSENILLKNSYTANNYKLFTPKHKNKRHTVQFALDKKNSFFQKLDNKSQQINVTSDNLRTKRFQTYGNLKNPILESVFIKDKNKSSREHSAHLTQSLTNTYQLKGQTERVHTEVRTKHRPGTTFKKPNPFFEREQSLFNKNDNYKQSLIKPLFGQEEISKDTIKEDKSQDSSNNKFVAPLKHKSMTSIAAAKVFGLMHQNLPSDTKKDTETYTTNERGSIAFTNPQSLNFRKIMRKSKDDIIKDMNTKTHGQKAKNMYIDVLLEKKEEESRNKLLDDIKQYRSSILQLINKLREKVKQRKEREGKLIKENITKENTNMDTNFDIIEKQEDIMPILEVPEHETQYKKDSLPSKKSKILQNEKTLKNTQLLEPKLKQNDAHQPCKSFKKFEDNSGKIKLVGLKSKIQKNKSQTHDVSCDLNSSRTNKGNEVINSSRTNKGNQNKTSAINLSVAKTDKKKQGKNESHIFESMDISPTKVIESKPPIHEKTNENNNVVDQDKMSRSEVLNFFSQMIYKKKGVRNSVDTWDKFSDDEKKAIIQLHYGMQDVKKFIPILDTQAKFMALQSRKQTVKVDDETLQLKKQTEKNSYSENVSLCSPIKSQQSFDMDKPQKIIKRISYYKDQFTDKKFCRDPMNKPKNRIVFHRKFSDEIEVSDKRQFEKHISSPILKRRINMANIVVFQEQARQKEVEIMNKRFELRYAIHNENPIEIGKELEDKAKDRIHKLSQMYKADIKKFNNTEARRAVIKDLFSYFIEAVEDSQEFLINVGGIKNKEIVSLIKEFTEAFQESAIQGFQKNRMDNSASQISTKGLPKFYGNIQSKTEPETGNKYKIDYSFQEDSVNLNDVDLDVSTISTFETQQTNNYEKMHKLSALMENLDSLDNQLTSRKQIIMKRKVVEICLKLIKETKTDTLKQIRKHQKH